LKRPKDTEVADPAREPQAQAAETPAPATEEKGLEGVDAPPLKPLTREEVEALRCERDELKDQLLRRRADFENYKKRVERDRRQASLEATSKMLKSLVPTLDNLERALRAGATEASLREGLELIYRELSATLEAEGLVASDPTGERFDPELHQAVSHEAVPGFDEGTIVETFQKGYFLKDRLLRPALVKVAKGQGGSESDRPEAIH